MQCLFVSKDYLLAVLLTVAVDCGLLRQLKMLISCKGKTLGNAMSFRVKRLTPGGLVDCRVDCGLLKIRPLQE